MARKKVVTTEPSSPASARPVRKRSAPRRGLEAAEELVETKRRRISTHPKANIGGELQDDLTDEGRGNESPAEEPAPTPTPRKRGRPPKATIATVAGGGPPTPSKSGVNGVVKTPVRTPAKTRALNGVDTPNRRAITDRSARRKSARALIDHVVGDASSDDEGGSEAIARAIYGSSGSEDEDEDGGVGRRGSDDELEGLHSTNATPSKTPRGRKKKATTARKKSPTPPRDLPPHEQYFYQNKPGLAKTSNNNLTSLGLLTHDEYFTLLRESKDQHEEDIQFLQYLHLESFPQWAFELSQGFSICLYGYGSKRQLLHKLATHLYSVTDDHESSKIVVVNGYVRKTTTREILSTIGSAVDSSYKLASGNQVTMLQTLLSLLSSGGVTITLIINSIDAPQLRKAGTQSILAQLAAHPQIRLVCSADTPDVSLLWDSGLRSSFNFLFHDCTTFAPYAAEIDVVDEVHELLGRKARRVGGKDGVAFVLRSLPENAKNLFRLLIGEVLVLMDEESGASGDNPGIEYRMLYNKAVEEFICSSEMAFRTLLKEYVRLRRNPATFTVSSPGFIMPSNMPVDSTTTR